MRNIEKEIQEALYDFYGVNVSLFHLMEILRQKPALKAEAIDMGVDTCVREWAIDEVGRWLGLDCRWPLGMDTEGYATAYFMRFKELATAKGGFEFRSGGMWEVAP